MLIQITKRKAIVIVSLLVTVSLLVYFGFIYHGASNDPIDLGVTETISLNDSKENTLLNGLDYDLPTGVQHVTKGNEENDYVISNYISEDYATSTQAVNVIGVLEETEIVISGYRLEVIVSRPPGWQRESLQSNAEKRADSTLIVANTLAYVNNSKGFVSTSLFHKNGKMHVFSIAFPPSDDFAEYEEKYKLYLDSVVIN